MVAVGGDHHHHHRSRRYCGRCGRGPGSSRSRSWSSSCSSCTVVVIAEAPTSSFLFHLRASTTCVADKIEKLG